MSDAVIVALITGACAVIAQLIIARRSSSELYAKLDKQSELSDANLKAELQKYEAVTNTKIDELTREVRLHNGHAEKIALLQAEDKRLNERLKILEQRVS